MSISKIKAGEMSKHEINRLLADAWLNINVKESELWNPIAEIPPEYTDNPHMWISWLMMQPDYFSFTCSEILNVEVWPMQGVILKDLWNHRFPILIGSRGLSKSFSLAVYALLRMLLIPGRKLVITGAAFRQSKIIFEYMESIWNNAPILRSICSKNSDGPARTMDMWTFRIGDSITRCIPLGNGEKIRGLRANDVIADEMSSITREIFETVIVGFGAVKSSPLESLKIEATKKLAKALNIQLPEEELDEDISKENQTIISGTAYYDFNHFADYWKRWKSIIMTGGDEDKLANLFNGNVPTHLSWKDFCVLRIPFELIPDGFMDKAQVERSRATIHSGIYQMEYGCVFQKDSAGFFKRSLVESCVASPVNNIQIDGQTIVFGPILKANKDCRYVMSIDPASEVDNFAITILEVHPTHRRIVYCWTTDKKDYRDRVKLNLVKDGDFYGFCARKIRDLMKVFPCIAIAIDSQGGGHQIVDRLHDKNLLEHGETPLWPIIDPDKPQDSDIEHGEHIIHIIQFSDSKWVSDANNGLRFDFESKFCLFPYNDAIDIALAMNDKENSNQLFDTLEDCIFELEELKNELATIVMTPTATGKDKWDTPDTKLPGQKKGPMRKDRYSALLMGNMVARQLQNVPVRPTYETEAAWLHDIGKADKGPLFSGPPRIVDILNDLYN